MRTSIDYAMDHLTKLFEELVRNVDTMSVEEFKDSKETIRQLAHSLFKTEIQQAFLAGTEAELEDTAAEYYYRTYNN